MSEFAPTAVQAVEVDRQNEILLFRPAEIENLVRCGSVDDLIKRKRKSFRIDGKVWFSGEKSRRESLKKFPFPEVTRSLRFQNTGTDFFENRSGFNPVVFTSHVPDFCGCEKGVRIDVTPQLDSISDLRGFLALVHNQLGLSSEGSFTISQIGYDWHGFGIENLLKEAERWKERYERARLEHIHHSEDLHYFDECHSGFILLTVRQQVKYTKAHLHGCRLQIQLPGIPIDTRPFVKICEGVRESLPYFAALATRESDSAQFRDGICLESVGQIISTRHGNEPLVCGLVVKNPFFEKKIPLPEGRLKYSPFTLLDSLEHLICDMSDWHNLNDIADQYRLTRLEGIQIADATIFRPVCTWDNIINRKFSNGQENQPLPSALDLLEREK